MRAHARETSTDRHAPRHPRPVPILDKLASLLTRPLDSTVELATAAEELTSRPAPIWDTTTAPAPRAVTQDTALSLIAAYRAISIHATAATQLEVDTYRGIDRIETPSLVDRPSLDMTREALIEYTVTSLYLDGAAFWMTLRDRTGSVITITPLDPREVTVIRDRMSSGRDSIRYSYRGRTYTREQIQQLDLLRVPGLPRGLGPIASCALSIRGALDARDYGAKWFTDSGVPDGVLTTDQVLTPAQGETYRNLWYGRGADGQPLDPDRDPSERIRILGSGMSYEPLLIKPSDAQFLETQAFTTTEIARLFGVPASLLHAAVDGKSMTYSNVEQVWTEYVRFSLLKALREIETAWSAILPGRQRVRFRIDSLLRADRKTRFEGHKTAIEAGFMTIDEIRALEQLPPMTRQDTAA